MNRRFAVGGDPVAALVAVRWIPAFAGMTKLCVLVLAALIFATPAAAQDTMPPAPYAYQQLDDPAKEAEARELMYTLRCLKCQSQSIADSDAPMAGDMRHQVRARIEAGETPEQIRGWMVERYGDYVSYSPGVSSTTWPLFVIPVILLLICGAVFASRMRRTGEAGAQD